MKTLLVNCSPKKKRSTSAYLLSMLAVSLGGEKETMALLPRNYEAVCESLRTADAVVLALPIYVDGVPGSVLRFFEYAEAYAAEHALPPVKIYAVVNCGFYEGRQTETSHRIIEHWCDRCGFRYMGGIGQGAGEMIGIIRFVNPFLAAAVTLLQFLITAVAMGSAFTFAGAWERVGFLNIIINLGLFFLFNTFMYIAAGRLAKTIRQGRSTPVLYSTVFCPRFLFVIFADLFWIIKALLRGVPFWALKARPADRHTR